MPTILRVGPYRVGFYSNETDEPPHVHVTRERNVAKFWLNPAVELSQSHGFARHELNEIRRIIEDHRTQLLEAWHEHFND